MKMAAKPQRLASATTPPLVTRRSSISISFMKRACTTTPLLIMSNNATTATATTSVADRLNNQATPWLMLSPEIDDSTGDKLERFYSLADGSIVRLNRQKSLKVPDTAKCFASTIGSWLGYADTKDGSLYLSNPFLNEVIELPSLGTMPRVVGVSRDPKSGSVTNFKVDMPDHNKGRVWNPRSSVDGDYSVFDPASMADTMISNLALSFDHPRYVDCVAMAIQGEPSRLAYCHIGKQFIPTKDCKPFGCTMNDGTFWSGLQEDFNPGGCNCDQVAYSCKDKVFYSFFDDPGLQAFDVKRDRGQRTKQVCEYMMIGMQLDLKRAFEHERGSEALKELRRMCCHKYYLVTLENGDLLLIVRHYYLEEEDEWEPDDDYPPYKTLHFDVFKVAYPKDLERVTHLEDRAIFIGANQSFCIKVGRSPGIEPNSIYFTDDDFDLQPRRKKIRWRHDNGIFSMSDGVITQFYPYHDEEEEKKVPLTTQLFWVAPVSDYLLCLAGDPAVSQPHCIKG